MHATALPATTRHATSEHAHPGARTCGSSPRRACAAPRAAAGRSKRRLPSLSCNRHTRSAAQADHHRRSTPTAPQQDADSRRTVRDSGVMRHNPRLLMQHQNPALSMRSGYLHSLTTKKHPAAGTVGLPTDSTAQGALTTMMSSVPSANTSSSCTMFSCATLDDRDTCAQVQDTPAATSEVMCKHSR
jgi:hypothetical protein